MSILFFYIKNKTEQNTKGFETSVVPYKRPLIFSLCSYLIILNGMEGNRTEWIGTEKQITQLYWNTNDHIFTQFVFGLMIVKDWNEVIAFGLLPRDIRQEALFFAALSIHRCPLLFFYFTDGTERNGTKKMDQQLRNKIECPWLEIFLIGKI